LVFPRILIGICGLGDANCDALKEEGVLCKETHENIIRIATPLVIQQDEIDWAIDRFQKVLE